MDRQVGSDLLNFEQFGKFLTNSILYEIGMTRQENNKIIIITPKLRYNESRYSEFRDIVNKCQLPLLLKSHDIVNFAI